MGEINKNMITIKEIQIKLPKWWQTAIIILVIIVAFKINPEQAFVLLKKIVIRIWSG